MSKNHTYGTRTSTWLKVQRCVIILRRLQRGPATRDELIQTVEASIDGPAYGKASEKALRRDLKELRATFGLTIQLRQGAYRLDEVGRLPLLDLPDDALEVLAFLYETFKPDAPEGEEVRRLLDTLTSYLPEERRHEVRRLRTIPRIELQRVDEGDIDDEVWDTIEYAVVKRRQLAFDYLSPRHEEPEPRHHLVEPYDLYFDDGHYYLDAYCLRWSGPLGARDHHDYIQYRVDYIVPGSAEVRPDKLGPGRRTPRTYTLRYELAPVIARGGVSRRFPETEVKIRDDGWAEVAATITNPFMAARRLLSYGAGCRVLGPAEVVRIIEEAVQGMAEVYGVC